MRWASFKYGSHWTLAGTLLLIHLQHLDFAMFICRKGPCGARVCWECAIVHNFVSTESYYLLMFFYGEQKHQKGTWETLDMSALHIVITGGGGASEN